MHTDDALSEGCVITATVRNPNGLHCRPMNNISNLAQTFDADITIYNDDPCKTNIGADAKSVLYLMSLAAEHGNPIRIVAIGPDALAACEALRKVIEQEEV